MDDTRECEYAAIRLLAQREHSRYELLRKLRQRFQCSEEVLTQVLDKLQNDGYQDDERYTEIFVRSAIARGRGPQRIQYELREKGVSDTLIAATLAELEVDWQTLASEQREKKFGSLKPADYKERARQSRFLAGRGFYSDTINAVFQCLPDD